LQGRINFSSAADLHATKIEKSIFLISPGHLTITKWEGLPFIFVLYQQADDRDISNFAGTS
jgi:hypothetical protein